LAIIAALLLEGCVTATPPSMVETTLGERPATCYVRARSFHGFVPMSCSEALLVRP
jgi:hypothetical protein